MPRRASRPVALILATAVAVGGGVLIATPAHAAPFSAANEADLITAINSANGNAEADVITLTGSGFALTADLPLITETLSIVGPGSGAFTLNADGNNGFESAGSGTNSSFSLTGIEIDNAGSFAVDTDNIDVVLSDLVVDSLIYHVTGDFSATDVEVDGAPSTPGFDIDVRASESVVLTRVAVSATWRYGIVIYAEGTATVSVDESTVTGSGLDSYDGFSATVFDTSSIEVTDSEFSDNVGDGFQIESFDSATVTVSGVTADRNEFDGIDLDGDDSSIVTVRNSSASDNDDHGFEANFEGGTGVYENVTAQGNSSDGFDLEADEGASITLTNPIALDNDDDGMNAEPDTLDAVVTINGGRSEGNGGFGLILNVDTGTAVADGMLITGNDVGGVYIDGYSGQATLRNSTVIDNVAANSGGIDVNAYDDGDGPLDVLIENTTVSGNVGTLGGGISGELLDGSTLTVRNSTISGNEAIDGGGGVYLDGDIDGVVTIEHSTITLNASEGGLAGTSSVFFSALIVTIDHSIIAGNTSTGPVDDVTEDDATLEIDYSIVQTADANTLAALTAGTGNIVGQSAGLGPLADNGGPTLTHLPLTGSPAISAGNASIVGAPATDQRGEDRVVGVIEIGSVEIQQPELAATGAGDANAVGAAALALLLVLGGSVLMVVRSRLRVSRQY